MHNRKQVPSIGMTIMFTVYDWITIGLLGGAGVASVVIITIIAKKKKRIPSVPPTPPPPAEVK